jgi:hypothetical protein
MEDLRFAISGFDATLLKKRLSSQKNQLMKPLMLSLLIAFTTLTAFQCNKSKDAVAAASCFKGKLVRKGVCMNYTISVIQGNIDPSLVEATWTHPGTGATYTNAFGLGTPCDFPNMEEGQEFYFKVNKAANFNCGVCQAYEPTPSKKLAIEVLSSPCQ